MGEDIDQSPIREAANEVRSKWTKWFELFKGFWRTKQAVQAGIPLYTWATAAVVKAGYFGAWKFNAIAIGITGGIATITTNLLNLLARTKTDDAQTFSRPSSCFSFEGDPWMD